MNTSARIQPVAEFSAVSLLKTSSLTIRDVRCQGSCRHGGVEESAAATELVFPYRGVFVRHLGHDQAVAERTRFCSSMLRRAITPIIPCRAAMQAYPSQSTNPCCAN